MTTSHRLLITLLSLLLIFVPVVHGADSSPQISIFYPPVKPLKYRIMVDILKHLDQRHNYGLKIELVPWKRAYAQGLNGKGGVLGLSKNEQRLKVFDYSDELYVDQILLVVLKGKEFPFDNIEDLQGKRIGGNAGSSYGDDFERGKKQVFNYLEDYRGASIRLKKLLFSRIDAALIGPGRAGFEEAISQDAQLKTEADKFSILPKPLVEDPNFLGFAKSMQMQDFLQRLNQDLRTARENGEIDVIIETAIELMSEGNQ